MGVAAGSVHYAWFAWFGLIPLLVAIRSLSPVKAMVSGASWGLCILLASLLVPTARNNPAHTTLSAAVLVAAPAIYAYMGAVLTGRIGFNPLCLALGWIAVEMAVQPFGIQKGLLAGIQADSAVTYTSAVTHVIGGILGYGFMSFLLVFASAFLLNVACSFNFRLRAPSRRFLSQVHDICLIKPPKTVYVIHRYLLQPANPRGPPSGFVLIA